MKNGTDMTDVLKGFYKIAVNYNVQIQKMNGIRWIVILEKDFEHLILGITNAGQWLFKDGEKYYILINKKIFLYCAKLLEIPYEEISKDMEERFEEIIKNEKISLSVIFPYFQIVEFAFGNLMNDYWFELAWAWYENFELSERKKLISQLENLSEIKKISQKNRQKVIKEIKRIG